jgi:hypothetical protein
MILREFIKVEDTNMFIWFYNTALFQSWRYKCSSQIYEDVSYNFWWHMQQNLWLFLNTEMVIVTKLHNETEMQ